MKIVSTISREAKIDYEYNQFMSYLDNPDTINAGLLDDIKSKLSFIKEFATLAKIKYEDLLKLFKDKRVFTLFYDFEWSLPKFMETMHQALTLMDKLFTQISSILSKNKVGKKMTDVTDKVVKAVDDYLDSNPIVKKLGGIFLAMVILYVAMNGVFVGSVSDFDLSDVLLAIAGKIKFMDVFGGENGVKLLISVALGWSGISVAYGAWATPAKAAVSLVSLLKKLR